MPLSHGSLFGVPRKIGVPILGCLSRARLCFWLLSENGYRALLRILLWMLFELLLRVSKRYKHTTSSMFFFYLIYFVLYLVAMFLSFYFSMLV